MSRENELVTSKKVDSFLYTTETCSQSRATNNPANFVRYEKQIYYIVRSTPVYTVRTNIVHI